MQEEIGWCFLTISVMTVDDRIDSVETRVNFAIQWICCRITVDAGSKYVSINDLKRTLMVSTLYTDLVLIPESLVRTALSGR